jgi:hypothetical protein
VFSVISVELVNVEIKLGLDSERIPIFGLYSDSQNCFNMLFAEGIHSGHPLSQEFHRVTSIHRRGNGDGLMYLPYSET